MKLMGVWTVAGGLLLAQASFASVLSDVKTDIGELETKITQAAQSLQQAKRERSSYRMSMTDLVSLLNDQSVTSGLKCSVIARMNGDTVDIAISDSDLHNQGTRHFRYSVNAEVIPHLDNDGLRVRIWRKGEVEKRELEDFFAFDTNEKLTHLGVTDESSGRSHWCNIHD